MSAAKVFVPSDTTARSLGADEVAVAILAEAAERNDEIDIVRNGSRGAYWLEPLVEVEVDGERRAYGPVAAADVAGLFDANFLTGGTHPQRLGAT
jgi:formate dehydrogenase iron-sulfur subunit